MPTKHPRHAITETGPVAIALADLRDKVGEDGFTLAELVVLGAQRKLFEAELAEVAGARSRARLAQMVRAGTVPVDIEAADEVRRSGWVRTV